MEHFKYLDFAIYFIGLFLWIVLWYFLVGFKQLSKNKFLNIPFISAILAFTINIFLALFASLTTYEVELSIYSYVENNARIIAQLALAIVLFVVLAFKRLGGSLADQTKKKFVVLILWSFLFSLLGCLPLYWVPPDPLWLAILRHLKTLPYMYSLFLLSTAIVVFIYELKKSKK